MRYDLDQLQTDETRIKFVGVGHVGRRITQELARSHPYDVGYDNETTALFVAVDQLIVLADAEDEAADLAGTVAGFREAGCKCIVAFVPQPPATDSRRAQSVLTRLRGWGPLLDGLFLLPTTDAELMDARIVEAADQLATVISVPGMMCIDFSDVVTVMRQPGWGRVVSGEASGVQRARLAAQATLDHPDLHGGISRAASILGILVMDDSCTLDEYYEILNEIDARVSSETTCILGTSFDETLGDQLRLVLFVGGLPEEDVWPDVGRPTAP